MKRPHPRPASPCDQSMSLSIAHWLYRRSSEVTRDRSGLGSEKGKQRYVLCETLPPLRTGSSNPPHAVPVVEAEQGANGSFLRAHKRRRTAGFALPPNTHTIPGAATGRNLTPPEFCLFAHLWFVPFVWPSIRPLHSQRRI